jgi:hypothetical protein
MKTIRYLILFLCAVQIAYGADNPLQRHKKSKGKEFDLKEEVAAFYLDLIEHNPAVQRQFQKIRSADPNYRQAHYGTDDPQVVEWFPRSGSGGIPEGFDTDTHFLVIHPLSFRRVRHNDYYMAVVSEFHLVQSSKGHELPNREMAVDSDEITITFMGFRNFKLTPCKQ